MGEEGKEESECPRRVRKHRGDRTSGERVEVLSTSIPRTREYGDIYPLDSFSLDLGRSGLSFCSPRLLFAQPKKTRHTLCSHNSTILCWRLALLLVPLSVWFFHIHPFRPSALTFPRHTVPRMFFVPLPLSHCHRSPLFSSMPRPRLLVSCLPVFPLHHPNLSCLSRIISFLYTAPAPMDERAVVIICGLSPLSSSSPFHLCRPAVNSHHPLSCNC
jgi:hypothetical protein